MKKLLAISLATNVALSAIGAQITMSLSKGAIAATSATVNYTLKNSGSSDVTQNGWAKLHIISESDDRWITIRSVSNSKSSFENNGSYTFTGLEPSTLYIVEWICAIESTSWSSSTSQSNMAKFSPGEASRRVMFRTLPAVLALGSVTTTPDKTSCTVVIPITEIGTGNESAQIEIVATGPDGRTHSATRTVTESGTVSMTIDDPPLLAGANYTAVVTVTGSKTGSVTQNLSFTTLASAPTLGALSTNAVEDVFATLSLPVTAIGEGNAYVDVLVTADGADGSSVTGAVQRVSADGGVAEVTLSGLTPYTEYTATAVATSSSGGTATQTLSFATRASDPQIGAVFVMSQQDTAGAFLVPVNSMGAGNTEVTITATAFGDDGTRAESSTVCTALGNNYATISGLSPGTPYAVTITVTGNHGGSATASTTLTTTGTRTTIVSVVVDGDTLPTRWLIDNGIIQNSLGLTEADLVELWGAKAANGMTLHECYVAGLDPGDPDANLVAYISMDEADEPVITWAPDLTPDRVYTVIGRTNLTDSGWVDPTNDATHFYKVKVSLP